MVQKDMPIKNKFEPQLDLQANSSPTVQRKSARSTASIILSISINQTKQRHQLRTIQIAGTQLAALYKLHGKLAIFPSCMMVIKKNPIIAELLPCKNLC